jgi:hypothetical protein
MICYVTTMMRVEPKTEKGEKRCIEKRRDRKRM